MKTLLLLSVLAFPYSEPDEDPELARRCAALSAQTTRAMLDAQRAQEARDRAAVTYYEARDRKLPRQATDAQVKAHGDALLLAHQHLQEAEEGLRLARWREGAVKSSVEEKRRTQGCPYSTPRG